MNLDKKIIQMLDQYENNHLSIKQRLREILQQCALLGLARSKFFEHAAFYGGTALRILYDLDRFSEDLDFSLLKPNKNFNLTPFLESLERELLSMGFDVEVTSKKKNNDSVIMSAFLKSNTKIMLLSVTNKSEKTHADEKIKIKFEVDTDPPLGFELESKVILNPVPFYVLTYKPADLFAGKMHAMLCRNWKNRIKGRDWYDFIWFLQKKTPLHLSHLEKRMKQSTHLDKKDNLTEKKLKEFLVQKIKKIDWKNATEDIKPFIYDSSTLKLWNKQFFLSLISEIKFI